MNQEQNLLPAAKTVFRWRNHILAISLVAAISTALVSVFVLDEYYLSKSIFYPVNQSLTERSFLFNTSTPHYVNYYGDKYDVNRLLTISNSRPLIDAIIQKFNLVDHYGIDRNKPHWSTKTYQRFEKNFKAIKTEKDAVELSLYDTDPRIAADIVNEMTRAIDSLNLKIMRESRTRMMDELSNELSKHEKELREMQYSTDTILKNNNLNIRYSEFGELLVEGDNFQARERARLMFREINNAQQELLNKNNIKDQIQVSLNNAASSLNIIEKAVPAEKRAKPQRAMMVAVAFLIALIFSVIGALLLEQFDDFRKQFNA